jgi:hypothetical protein|tara:strand:- start:478 stop:1164 length:687 start_codon:yes stop_codon:yes gene_type:complete
MKLSADTINVLKNFAAINSQVVLNPGNVIKTMAESKTILSSATIAEEIPNQIGIYDLNEFLGVLGMFDDPDLTFDENFKFVRVSQDRRAIKYFFSDPSILTSPQKDVIMPEAEVKFTFTQEDLSAVRKAASALGISTAVVTGKAGETTTSIIVTDVNDATSNSFEVQLDDCTRDADEPFEFVFNIANFKITNGDYQVAITKKLISHFTNTNSPVEYWIALEKSSTYGA